MKRFTFLGTVAFLLALTAPFKAFSADGDIVFTYDYEGATHDLYGIQRQVQTDVAMLIQDQSLVGFEIIGVSVDVPSKEGCSCDPIASAWLTKKLQVDGEYNLPDVQQVNGEIKNYGTEENPELRLDLTFPQPYKLTEEGIYVGYSLTVTNCKTVNGWTAKYPIVTVCDVDKPQCFMIHCNKGESTLPQRYAEWTDLGETMHQALAMRVILRGNSLENAASLIPQQTLYVAPGTSGKVFTDLNNYGVTPISSIEYSYTVAGEGVAPRTITNELTLDSAVPGQIGAYKTLDLSFEAPEEVGKYSVEIRVDKVNGIENSFDGISELEMDVVPFLPENHPLIEDYTGLWCGYCPAVYVAVKQMHDKYGDDFLSIAYHIEDQLQTVRIANAPSSSYGLPVVYMGDRSKKMDYENMEYLWQRAARTLAPAQLDVQLYWNDEEHTALRAESTTKFIYDDPEAQYIISYAMVEDGMSNPRWQQTNKYYDKTFEGPYWDLFCGTTPMVSGLVYDDVIVSYPNAKGIEGSLPGNLAGGEEYKHSAVLPLKDAVCVYEASPNAGNNVIIDPDKLRIVAVLIDGKTGNVCNAASTGYSADAIVYKPSSIDTVDGGFSDAEVISETYYSLDGLKLNEIPEGEAVIKVMRLADGRVRTEKILR